jgi:hypothetical protein
MSLRPCASCRRLVRHADSLCPFCGAEAPPTPEARASEPFQRRSRAALLVGALAVAGASVGCATERVPVAVYGGPPNTEPADAGQAVAPDPVPSPAASDAGQAFVTPPPSQTSMPTAVSMYSAPPLPSHTTAPVPRPTNTAPVAAYGAAPMPGPKP